MASTNDSICGDKPIFHGLVSGRASELRRVVSSSPTMAGSGQRSRLSPSSPVVSRRRGKQLQRGDAAADGPHQRQQATTHSSISVQLPPSPSQTAMNCSNGCLKTHLVDGSGVAMDDNGQRRARQANSSGCSSQL
ncbi:hypothetical protein ACLOJK_024047 [Asimina triloba]